jgi:hypothetical protein
MFPDNQFEMMDARTKPVKSRRSRLRRHGFRRLEVQVPADDVAVIRKAAAILRNPTQEAVQLRRTLGFAPKPSRALTALEIFAMPEPLSAKVERRWKRAMKQVERDRNDPRLNRPRDVDL